MTEKLIFRMSEAGECPKALVAERLGKEAAPAPVWLATAAEEGKRHEQWVKEDLRKEGYEIEECQLCQICKDRYGVERQGIHVELEYPNFILTGHLDGRFTKNGTVGGLEIKSMSQYEFDRWMRDGFAGFPDYAGQLTVYMLATLHKEWLYVVKNRSSGYKDKKTITEPPTNSESIFKMLDAVVLCIHSRELPEIEYNASSIQCQRCKYQKLCLPVIKALSPVEEADLLTATAKWREGKSLEKRGKQLVEEASKMFEFHSQATGLDRWRFDELAISYIHIKENVTYPKENLLRVFTEEQLKVAAQIKLPYDYIKTKDLRRGQSGEEAEMSE